MHRRPPRSTLFPTRRSSDLDARIVSEQRILGRQLQESRQRNFQVQRRDLRQKTRAHQLIARLPARTDRKSTRLNSSHSQISYAVFCLKKKKNTKHTTNYTNN